TAGEAADMLSHWCSEALTRTAELQRSGELDVASELPGQLVYLRAAPGWWSYSERGRRRWPRVSVHAEDDLAGRYVSTSGDGPGHGDPEELALGFLPRLDPLARSLRLTFTAA